MVDKHNHEQPDIYDAPSDVDAKDGVVSVKGPDAVDVNLTPDAAVDIGSPVARLDEGAGPACPTQGRLGLTAAANDPPP